MLSFFYVYNLKFHFYFGFSFFTDFGKPHFTFLKSNFIVILCFTNVILLFNFFYVDSLTNLLCYKLHLQFFQSFLTFWKKKFYFSEKSQYFLLPTYIFLFYQQWFVIGTCKYFVKNLCTIIIFKKLGPFNHNK